MRVTITHECPQGLKLMEGSDARLIEIDINRAPFLISDAIFD
jgi:hypothetical protein